MPSNEQSRIEVEQKDNHMTQTAKDADPLEEFAIQPGEKVVRWDPWGDCRSDDDVWVVQNVRWQYRVTKLWERDGVPTKEDHRRYVLLSRETWDEAEVAEEDLLRGDWRRLSEVED